MNKRVLWITRTAVFVALLLVAQMITAPMGNQFVTGSVVNLILIVSVMTCGLASGAAVAAVSPVFAKLIGIGPQLWSITPVQMAGNVVLILLWHFIGNNRFLAGKDVGGVCALVVAAVAKCATLYAGVVLIVIPVLGLADKNPAQAATLTTMFSLPQIATASIGGAFALVVLPLLRRAVKS